MKMRAIIRFLLISVHAIAADEIRGRNGPWERRTVVDNNLAF